jgi:ABC-2 type transport system permease protein
MTATLTGTGTLVRFLLRRDRIRIAGWVGGLAVVTLATANNFTQIYATAAERQTIASTMESPAGIAMVGVNHGIGDYTYGAMLGHQMLWFTAMLAGLMSALLIVRYTRTEEAAGRAELVRAAVVGRHATTAAALVVVAAANLAVAVLMALGLGAIGIEGVDWQGSVLYGAAHAATGLVFAGIAAVTAQVTEHPRGAAGMAVAAIGLAYVLRAVGDVTGGTLSWLSPIGWAQATQVYVVDRWWALLPALAATAALVTVAVALGNRRDVGAGLRPPRRGSPVASDALATPLGFAFRLHRASLLGWVVALFVGGVMYGSVLGEAERWLAEIEAVGELVPQIEGVTLTEAFASVLTIVLAIFAGVYAVLAAQRMRSEEVAGRAEPVLATAVSRTRWVASHVAVAMGGAVAVLLAAGVGLAVTGAASTQDAELLPALLGATLVHVPALWVTTAIVVALFGLLPRAIPLAWAVVLYSFVVLYLGELLRFPDWMGNLSPFGHTPGLPAEAFTLAPLAVLTAIAAVLVAVGLGAFRRRDLDSPT